VGPGKSVAFLKCLRGFENCGFIHCRATSFPGPTALRYFPNGERLFMYENGIYGYWRIKEMEMWDPDFIDAEVPGYFHFDEDDGGEFQFGYVHGYLDCRYSMKNGKNYVEFSFDGNDEMDPTSGRGFAAIEGDVIVGRLFFHEGDDSEFKAIRKEAEK
jgi:hypothetical protein